MKKLALILALMSSVVTGTVSMATGQEVDPIAATCQSCTSTYYNDYYNICPLLGDPWRVSACRGGACMAYEACWNSAGCYGPVVCNSN